MDSNAQWYIDGTWAHPHEASISVNDVAVLRGYSVFESLRTYDRRPFHLDAHLARLFHSARVIELDVLYTHEELAEIVREVIARNAYKHASLRILVTGGVSEDGVTPGKRPALLVLITPLGERDMERFARGYRLVTSRLHRENPEAKTSSYTAAIRALKDAARHNADDALFVNERGHLLECTRSNFFILRGDTLVTPVTGVLIGITRNVVLELARGRFPIEERPIELSELALADEAFVTSSSKEITPVLQIDEQVIGNGQPGPRTSELEQRFIAMVAQGDF